MLRTKSGFTLVELLIVVLILGILAGVVLPAFSGNTEDANVSATIQNLQSLRASSDLYKVQHAENYPGYPVGGGTPTETLFTTQLSLNSKKDGATAALGTATYVLGPYVKNGIPPNPFNGKSSVLIIADATAFPTAGDDATGWVFKPKTGEFKANTAVTLTTGEKVFDF